MRLILTICLLLLPFLAFGAGNTTNDSFNRAKKMLERNVYYDHRQTIYCEAEYDEDENIRLPSGFVTPAHEKRIYKMEWEHAVPAENFGRAFREWRDGDPQCVHRGKSFRGRRCAEKVNPEFRHMQADMYNLFPSIGAVNAVRSNKQYREIPEAKAAFGSCGAKVADNGFEPPRNAKGQVARAALYMADAYPQYRLSRQQKQLFDAWDKMFPVTPWECARAARIEEIQGNSNHFVKAPCERGGMYQP